MLITRDPILNGFIDLVQEEMNKLAHDTLEVGKVEVFQLAAGKYQGLRMALTILDEVMQGKDDN